MIRSELRFKTVDSVTERCGHHSCVGDDHVERLTFCQQHVGAGTHALQVGKLEFNHFERSVVGRGVLSNLLGCSFRLVQIPCRAYDLSTVGGQGPRGFHAEPGRDAGYQNSFAVQIHARQNVFRGRSCSE
jgi:hypothetical protein